MPTTSRGLGVAAAATACVLVATRPSGRWLVRALGLALLPLGAVVLPLWLTDAELGARITTRALCVAVATLAFASTQKPHELGAALRGLGVPRSLSAVVATLTRQAARLVPEGRRLLLARELRGARTWWVGPDVMAHLLVRTTRRAERVALAAELRGASAGVPRPAPMSGADGWILGAVLCLCGVMHWMARAPG
jgi:energy-coupling factor transporter transmembrane protein EcfT